MIDGNQIKGGRMKRTEMVSYIKDELEDFLTSYDLASDKRKPHVIRASADGILAMLEGFGMKPPALDSLTLTTLEGKVLGELEDDFSWEDE